MDLGSIKKKKKIVSNVMNWVLRQDGVCGAEDGSPIEMKHQQSIIIIPSS